MTLVLITATAANAASLDLLEVGGAYGTPGATNPTALWWNPAGLAVNPGLLSFHAEGAPTFGRVNVDRDNPDYGEISLSQSAIDRGYPTEYNYGGSERFAFAGVVPFLGVSSNLSVPGLGVGAGIAIPTARGGTSDQEWGPNRYQLRAANITTIHLMLGGAYQFADKVAIGARVSLVDSSWYADTDTSILVDLANVVQAPEFQDGYIEQQGYTATSVFGGERADGSHGALRARTATFAAGLYLTPLGKKLGISLAYNHGMRLDHSGDLTMKFQCPPEYDLLGSAGAQLYGLCNATLQGKGTAGYNLPSRVHLGVVLRPIDALRLEAMGAYVFWSAFTDYELTTSVTPDEFMKGTNPLNESFANDSADLVSQELLWARDNQDSFWVGLDGKVNLPGPFRAGARVMYDHHAIPASVLSANNVDFDTVIAGASAEVRAAKGLGIGLGYTHQFFVGRTVTDSAFAVSLDPDIASPGRYFYPSANGSYGGSIDRLSLFVRGRFGTDEL